MLNWKGSGLIKVLFLHLQGGIRKTRKKTCQDSGCPRQDFNWAPQKYRSTALLLHQPLVTETQMSVQKKMYRTWNATHCLLNEQFHYILIHHERYLLLLNKTYTTKLHANYKLRKFMQRITYLQSRNLQYYFVMGTQASLCPPLEYQWRKLWHYQTAT